MTRLACIVLALVALAACDKPTPEDCRKALLNMQHLLGTETLNTDASLQGEIRRCRGGSKRKAVECAIKAQTLDELRACDFEKVPGRAPLGAGSAVPPGASVPPAPIASPPVAPPSGSATAGSATATGSASGSAK